MHLILTRQVIIALKNQKRYGGIQIETNLRKLLRESIISQWQETTLSLIVTFAYLHILLIHTISIIDSINSAVYH